MLLFAVLPVVLLLTANTFSTVREEAEVKDAELALAVQLIDQAASDEFKPENYRDEVRDRVLDLINRKVEGEDITVASSEEPEHKIIDIMEALKASIEAGGKDTTKRKPAKRASAKKATAKKKAATRRKKAAQG